MLRKSLILYSTLLSSLATLVAAAPVSQDVCQNPGRLLNWQLFEVCSSVCNVYKPKNVDEVVQIVQSASRSGRGLKAVAAKHSFTDNLCKVNADIIDMTGLDKVVEINREDGYVVVEAGIRFLELAAALKKEGLSYGWATVEWPLITVGGALANGAHHSGWSNVNHMTVPSATLAVDIVNAKGELITITDGDRLAAVRTNLGLLGVVVRIKYAVHEDRKLRIGIESRKESEMLSEGFLPTLERNDAIISAYFPPLHRFVTIKMNRVNSTDNTPAADQQTISNNISSNHFKLFEQAIKCSTVSSTSCNDTAPEETVDLVGNESDVIQSGSAFGNLKDHVSRLIPDISLPIGIGDSELVVPFKKQKEALNLVKNIFKDYPYFGIGLKGASVVFPVVQFRFGKPDTTTFLAQNAATSDEWAEGAMWMETWYIVTQANEEILGKLRNAYEKGIMELGGRPHWGKNRESTFEGGVKHLYGENFEKFQKVMKEMDPDGVFYNTFAQRAGL